MLNDLLQELPTQALYSTLASRLNHWDEQYDEMQVVNMIELVKAVSSLVPPFEQFYKVSLQRMEYRDEVWS